MYNDMINEWNEKGYVNIPNLFTENLINFLIMNQKFSKI